MLRRKIIFYSRSWASNTTALKRRLLHHQNWNQCTKQRPLRAQTPRQHLFHLIWATRNAAALILSSLAPHPTQQTSLYGKRRRKRNPANRRVSASVALCCTAAGPRAKTSIMAIHFHIRFRRRGIWMRGMLCEKPSCFARYLYIYTDTTVTTLRLSFIIRGDQNQSFDGRLEKLVLYPNVF